MHAMFFAAKSAYLQSMVFQRRISRDLGITPARFDLLSTIGGSRWLQDDVARRLGVTRSNVGRMMRALERLGWVVRARDEVDGRKRVVSLTERALAFLGGEGRLRTKWAHKAFRKLSLAGRWVADWMANLEDRLSVFHWFGWAKPLPIYAYGHPDD